VVKRHDEENSDNSRSKVIDIEAHEFENFFRDVHGYNPFPWQNRLTTEVLSTGVWPRVIDLPTGTGKTAVIDTAIFALAVNPTISPRRIVFVIDRRIVVDQVQKRALKIRQEIESAATPLLERVQAKLKRLSDGEEVLGVAALRGGIPVDYDWVNSPDEPWIIVTTVDQFGSRIFFRGYGVSKRMRSVHAGLVGNDSLVILDEVHLSIPFADTLNQLRLSYPTKQLPQRGSIVEMSATPRDSSIERFTLSQDLDIDQCPELKRRVCASKYAKLVDVRSDRAVPNAILKIVQSIEKSSTSTNLAVRSVGVIVNRVRAAREIFVLISQYFESVFLLTGRMRPLDRLDVLQKVEPYLNPDRAKTDTPFTILVSTQAIEVGADFSFDALITECAPIDSLRQRFGRLNRRGRTQETGSCAKAWIIGSKSLVDSSRPDPVYGEAAKFTWRYLNQRVKDNGLVDVGTIALKGGFPSETSVSIDQAPLLLKIHMDAWVQTNPEPIVQPSLDGFLHGINQNQSSEVSLIWRWDHSLEALRIVPPRQTEFVQLPIEAVKAWLSQEQKEWDVSDAGPNQSIATKKTSMGLNDETLSSEKIVWGRWEHTERKVEHIKSSDISPGDLLILDPAMGGLNAGNWDPNSKDIVEDFGDRAQLEYDRRLTLRLDARLPYFTEVPRRSVEDPASEQTEFERIKKWVEAYRSENEITCVWLETIFEKLGTEFVSTYVSSESRVNPLGYFILERKHTRSNNRIVDIAILDGSDETNSFTSTRVTLKDHLNGVGERAGEVANRLNLSTEIINDLRLAGRLHDIGKVDQRFQMWLTGGDSVEIERYRDLPLAKSLHRFVNHSTYPKGMRHEFASVAMVSSCEEALSEAVDRDLVLHLIGTHHGFGRPLPQLVNDTEVEKLSFQIDGLNFFTNSNLTDTTLAFEMADRFWRLVDRYGYHGLSWLESILRLADQRQSAEEAQG